MTQPSPVKRCPDCAEKVLSAARRCRFCGYRFDAVRFDTARPAPQPDAPSGLLGVIRPPSGRTDPADILLSLGVVLSADEQLSGLWFGQVGGADVYVVITSTRLVVVNSAGRRRASGLLLERPLTELAGARLLRRRWARGVVVEWLNSDATVISKVTPGDLPRLYSALLAHAPSGAAE